jgi:soluble lytic murein transglycosylase-like protein
LGVTNAYDPAQNISGGTRYIRGLLERFHGDVRLAVAAYNAGPGAVEKYHGVPPYAETQNYVENVLGSYDKYKGR